MLSHFFMIFNIFNGNLFGWTNTSFEMHTRFHGCNDLMRDNLFINRFASKISDEISSKWEDLFIFLWLRKFKFQFEIIHIFKYDRIFGRAENSCVKDLMYIAWHSIQFRFVSLFVFNLFLLVCFLEKKSITIVRFVRIPRNPIPNRLNDCRIVVAFLLKRFNGETSLLLLINHKSHAYK